MVRYQKKSFTKSRKNSLLQSLDNKMRTFEEYKKFVSKTQKDKDKNTVILYSNDAEKQDSYIEDAKKRNYDVVLFDNVIDSHYINHIEQNLTKYR